MRIRLTKEKLKELFGLVEKFFPNFSDLAEELGVSPRTIRDWRRGAFLMSDSAFNFLTRKLKISSGYFDPEFVDNYWYVKKGAKIGGLRRCELYGNPGTMDGRSRGGTKSCERQGKLGGTAKGGFKILKDIKIPEHTENLAEFMGIMLGDGHLAEYQASVCTNATTDITHAKFVQALGQKLFNVPFRLRMRKLDNAVEVIASSRKLVIWLNEQGMPRGNKLKALRIPDWIKTDDKLLKKFIRGLFDTDGCVFLDHHKIKEKHYYSLGWTFTSYNDNLLKEVLHGLQVFGFKPTWRMSQRSVFMRRRGDVHRYFEFIGTSNPKHLKRYQEFSGRVPKRSQWH